MWVVRQCCIVDCIDYSTADIVVVEVVEVV